MEYYSSLERKSSQAWKAMKKPLVQSLSHVMGRLFATHGLQHARLPCPPPTLEVYSNLGPSSRWCHLTISSSVVPFSCFQSLPASGSYPVSWLFASGGQSLISNVEKESNCLWFPYIWDAPWFQGGGLLTSESQLHDSHMLGTRHLHRTLEGGVAAPPLQKWKLRLPESNSSNQGFNLKRWRCQPMRQPLGFLWTACLFQV